MNKKAPFFALLLMIFFSTVPLVSAENEGALGAVGDMFRALIGTSSIAEFYGNNYDWFDFAILLIIFIGLSQVALGSRFNTRGGKAVVIALGVALAVGGTWWLNSIGRKIGDFGPIAGMAIAVLFGFALFEGMKRLGGEEHKFTAVAIAYLVIYFGAKSWVPEIVTLFEKTPFAGPLLPLLSAIAMLYIAFQIMRLIYNLFFKGASIPSVPDLSGTGAKLRGWGDLGGKGLGAMGAGLGKALGALNRQEGAIDVAEEKQARQIERKAARSLSNSQKIKAKLQEIMTDIQRGDIKELRKDYADMLPSAADIDESINQIGDKAQFLRNLQRQEVTKLQEELNASKRRLAAAQQAKAKGDLSINKRTLERIGNSIKSSEQERLLLRKEIGRAQGLLLSQRTLRNHINLFKASVRQGRGALLARNKAAALAAFKTALDAIERIMRVEKGQIKGAAKAVRQFEGLQRKHNALQQKIEKQISKG